MPTDVTATRADRDAPPAAVLDRAGLDALIGVLAARGFRVVGPVRGDTAIVLDDVRSVDDLPAGWGVETAPGRYRLRARADGALFAHSAGAQSWKQFLHPPRRPVGTDRSDPPEAPDAAPLAFLGVRGCDLAAIATLGGALVSGPYPDRGFGRRRRGLFVVAVGCTEPGGVCFCASMGTGPAPGPGYDLALTEQIDAAGHRFVVDVGTPAGAEVLADVAHRPAARAEVEGARADVEAARTRMGRAMPDGDLRALLADSRESPRWQDVADRCLSCGNCTMVCPTCFCTTVEDTTDLADDHPGRAQRWASCFEIDFSYLHGGSVRTSGASRYRQWITHKLGTWHDQFGTSGCVGCGRCIAWCPTGIDITAEIDALAAARAGNAAQDGGSGADR